MKSRLFIAALLSGVLYAPQASAEPPAVFIHNLYAHYKDADPWAKGFDPYKDYYEADFAKLVKAARKKHAIDYDPTCQCKQGGGNFMMFSGRTGASDSEYLAKMKKLGEPRGGWTLHLKWVDGGWKIHDVVETRNGKPVSLRQRLAGTGK